MILSNYKASLNYFNTALRIFYTHYDEICELSENVLFNLGKMFKK